MRKLKTVEDLLLFLTLLFLPTQLGKHFWPDFSYIYSLKIDYLSPALYLWDLLVIGLVIVWFLSRPAVNKSALNLLLLFLLTQVLSLLGADNPGAGLVRLEQYLVVGSFGLFLASQDFKGLLKRIYWTLGLGILGESVIAILQFIKSGSIDFWILGERTFSISTPGIAKFDFYGSQFLRPYATFPHPNVLAGFILIGISIIYQVIRKSHGLARLALVFGGITVFFAMSRAAILAGLILTALFVKRKWLIGLGLLILLLSPVLFTRFSSLFNFDNLTLLRREEQVGAALQIFLKYPLAGVGLNNFIPTIANDLTVGPSRFLQPVHNIFLLALSETGLVGLVGLVVLIGFPLLKLFHLYPIRHTLYPILLPWLIILFLGMFDHYLLTLPQGYRMLFLVWGLSFSMLKIENKVKAS